MLMTILAWLANTLLLQAPLLAFRFALTALIVSSGTFRLTRDHQDPLQAVPDGIGTPYF
jgi:hypothetical protein